MVEYHFPMGTEPNLRITDSTDERRLNAELRDEISSIRFVIAERKRKSCYLTSADYHLQEAIFKILADQKDLDRANTKVEQGV